MHVAVQPPFDLEATIRLLQRRPRNPLDRFVEGTWLRLLDLPGGQVAVGVRQEAPDSLELRWPHGRPTAAQVRKVMQTVRRMLGLDVELDAFHRAAARYPGLRPLAALLAGIRPPRFASLFEAILGVVPFQQLSLDSGMAVFARLVEAHGVHQPVTGPGEVRELYAAPRPEAIEAASEETLRAHGLSGAKARSLRDAARAILEGHIDEATLESLPTPEARTRLLKLKGIGPWSADLILLRGFGRLDAFPPGDVGVANGLLPLLGETPPEELARAFAPQQGMLYYTSLISQLANRGILRR